MAVDHITRANMDLEKHLTYAATQSRAGMSG
jgi:hypothetical protein